MRRMVLNMLATGISVRCREISRSYFACSRLSLCLVAMRPRTDGARSSLPVSRLLRLPWRNKSRFSDKKLPRSGNSLATNFPSRTHS